MMKITENKKKKSKNIAGFNGIAHHFAARKYFFVSYPKSGRTWVRFMLSQYLCRHYGVDSANVFRGIKKLRYKIQIKWTHLGGDFNRPYYGLLNFEDRLITDVPYFFLKRNFYSILASAYHHRVYRNKRLDIDTAAFIRHPYCGIVHLISYYNMWHRLREEIPALHYCSYRGMKRTPQAELQGILARMGFDVNPDYLNEAVALGSMDSMKQLAKTPEYANSPIAPTDPRDPKTEKVRQGKRAGYRELFSADDLIFIEEIIDKLFEAKDDPEFAECVEKSH
jgi:hypothetical protein